LQKRIRKSTILLIVLIIASVIQYALFRLSTGTLLLFLLTFIAAVHIGLKELKKRYPGRPIRILSNVYRAGLLAIGLISITILILVIRPIKECRQLNPQMIQNMDHMIVLGAGLEGDQVSKRLKLRLDKALDALKMNQEMIAIVSGGQGSDELISEAEAMKRYLVEAGIEEGNIIKEDKSTSTYQNFLRSNAIIDKRMKSRNRLIVTSDFHVFRSTFIAKSMGWHTQAICSKSEPHVLSNYLIREIPAVVNDYLKVFWLNSSLL